GLRTLVVVDNEIVRQTHSLFLGSLAERGHEVTVRVAGEGATPVALAKYGEYMYDNLILLAPLLNETTPGVRVSDVMGFTESGGNVIAAGDVDMGLTVRALGALSGIEFDRPGTRVIDHFGRASLLPGAVGGVAAVTSRLLLGAYLDGGAAKPVFYSGVGHAIESDNIQAVVVLKGSGTAYTADPSRPIGRAPENAGGSVALVTAVQARNNARLLVAGSLAMFSDQFFQVGLTILLGLEAAGAGNAVFCTEVSRWALRERGVLRASDVAHSRADGTAAELLLHQKDRRDLPFSLFPEPEIAKHSQVYRIKDLVTYSVTIEEYDAAHGGWRPYVADDVQMDFVMLDPFERITLGCDRATGRFHTTFVM
ncbi:unnamed protein product, partial [Phaeothamnion confervicola]